MKFVRCESKYQNFYEKANFSVIVNGVNIDEYPPEKAVNESSYFTLMTTARIVERKGIQHVIAALPRISIETDSNIRYIIVGDGPYRKEIVALARELEVDKYVEITGMLPFEHVKMRLLKADLFILTSHWEGMPNSVVEAMASHLPIIMTNCEGSSELVEDNGFIIDLKSDIEESIATYVLELYRNRDLCMEMGKNSYERVLNHFSWEKSTKAFLERGTNP